MNLVFCQSPVSTQQIDLSCQTIVDRGFQNIEVIGGILAEECLELFKTDN